MKPFLGIDITTDKKNEQINGAEFLVCEPSPAMAQALQSSTDLAEEMMENAKLPTAIRAGHWICGLVGALVVISLLRSMIGEDAVTLPQAYENAPWLFWVGGGCLLVWGILKLIAMQKEKAVMSKEENAQIFTNLNELQDTVFAELSIPKNAPEVDVLSFFYKEKEGNIKVCEKGLQIAPYLNPVFHIFSDAENLYLANLEGKYAFPRSSIQGIHTVKKTIRIVGWNKDVEPNDETYAPYKLTTDNYGCVICKRYHILEVKRDGENWSIYFPNYELPAFEAATGIKAEEILK